MDIETNDPPAYEAPKIVDYGSLRELTTATSTGTFADVMIPAGGSITGHLSTTSHGF